ncbi:MAG: cytochrome c oxidase assembly protein [Rhizobiaceae bacterium]|nr:cytochrome c oxidase assembly protein [Rhizobiaceae bacterium]MCV0405648.1 cytochrome c oxidase assembly protein [Rhizobiaceae bacterium]
MARQGNTVDNARARTNRVIALACLAFFGAMVGMAYAAVPLYQLFCQVTGYGGTTQRVEQYSDTILDREVTVRFDANTSGGLSWEFRPKQRQVKVRIGETVKVEYEARNVSARPASGRANFNVSPHLAGSYFNKVECFCFTDTTLQPGESMDMPVVFFVDPAIVEQRELDGLHSITLSYTFFPIETDEPMAGAPASGETKTDTTLGG